MAKVLRISQETGLSGARGRDSMRNDSLRLVETRLRQWEGRETLQCRRFVEQMNGGIWDLTALPELPAGSDLLPPGQGDNAPLVPRAD